MNENMSGNGFVPLIKCFESGNLILPLSLRALVCMRLIDLFMHNHGNRKTIFINPATLELKLGEKTDYSWPDCAFEAPKDTNWDAVGYILAIYISLVLTGTHPYKGRRWFELAFLDQESERSIFVEHCEYILSTDSNAPNAPQEYAQSHVKTLFNTLTPPIREMLKSGFGMFGKEWFPHDIELYIHTSEVRQVFWDVFANSFSKGRSSIEVDIERYKCVLSPGKPIVFPSTLMSIGHCDEAIAKSGKKVLVAVNDTDNPWEVYDFFFQRDGRNRIKQTINYRGKIIIESGMSFDQEGENIQIFINPNK